MVPEKSRYRYVPNVTKALYTRRVDRHHLHAAISSSFHSGPVWRRGVYEQL